MEDRTIYQIIEDVFEYPYGTIEHKIALAVYSGDFEEAAILCKEFLEQDPTGHVARQPLEVFEKGK